MLAQRGAFEKSESSVKDQGLEVLQAEIQRSVFMFTRNVLNTMGIDTVYHIAMSTPASVVVRSSSVIRGMATIKKAFRPRWFDCALERTGLSAAVRFRRGR